MVKPHKSIVKSISIVLVMAFFIQELSFAAPPGGVTPLLGGSRSIDIIAQDPTLFQAPSQFVTMREVHKGTNGTFIIHIQDAHINLSGQQNMAAALDEIMSKYKVSMILSEGGANDCSLTPIKSIAPKEVWERVAKSYLIQGEISGEEYLNLVSDHPMKIMGIEDMGLYIKSVENYGKLADKRQDILEYLKIVQRSLDKLKNKFYPSELLDYEKNKTSGNDPNAKSFETSFTQLIDLAKSKNVDLSLFPGLTQLASVMEKEKEIDFTAANLEQGVLIEEIARHGGKEDLEEHLKKMGEMKDKKVALFTYFQNTLSIAKEKNINVNNYQNLMKYVDYLRTFSDIDLDQVLDQLLKAEDKVYSVILSGAKNLKARSFIAGAPQDDVVLSQDDISKDSRLIRAIDRFIGLLKTAYNIQMTTKEFDSFEINEPDFSTVSYLAFINRKLAETGYFEDLIPYKNNLDEGKKALEAFYDSVSKRDSAFIRNTEKILKDEKTSRPSSLVSRPSSQVAIMITGGYHTQNLKKLFKEKGYSYAVLTPLITSETNQKKYENRLLSPIRGKAKKIEIVQGESGANKKSLSALDRDLAKPRKDASGVKVAMASLGLDIVLLKGMLANPGEISGVQREDTLKLIQSKWEFIDRLIGTLEKAGDVDKKQLEKVKGSLAQTADLLRRARERKEEIAQPAGGRLAIPVFISSDASERNRQPSLNGSRLAAENEGSNGFFTELLIQEIQKPLQNLADSIKSYLDYLPVADDHVELAYAEILSLQVDLLLDPMPSAVNILLRLNAIEKYLEERHGLVKYIAKHHEKFNEITDLIRENLALSEAIKIMRTIADKYAFLEKERSKPALERVILRTEAMKKILESLAKGETVLLGDDHYSESQHIFFSEVIEAAGQLGIKFSVVLEMEPQPAIEKVVSSANSREDVFDKLTENKINANIAADMEEHILPAIHRHGLPVILFDDKQQRENGNIDSFMAQKLVGVHFGKLVMVGSRHLHENGIPKYLKELSLPYLSFKIGVDGTSLGKLKLPDTEDIDVYEGIILIENLPEIEQLILEKNTEIGARLAVSAVQRPIVDAAMDPEKVRQWIDAQPTATLKDLAAFIAKNITYIDQERFEAALRRSIRRFVDDNPSVEFGVSLLGAPSPGSGEEMKSNGWTYQIAREDGLPEPKGILSSPDRSGLTNVSVDWLRKNPTVNDLMYIDDASYSGKQLEDWFSLLAMGIMEDETFREREVKIHFLIPFMTENAKKSITSFVEHINKIITEQGGKRIQLVFYDEELMANVEGIFSKASPEVRNAFFEIYGQTSGRKTLTYFQHKKPDYVSAPSSQASSGTVLDGPVLRVNGTVSDIIPFIPPVEKTPYARDYLEWIRANIEGKEWDGRIQSTLSATKLVTADKLGTRLAKKKLTTIPESDLAEWKTLGPVLPIAGDSLPGFSAFYFEKGAGYGSQWDWLRQTKYGDPDYFHEGIDFFKYQTTDGKILDIPEGTPLLSIVDAKVYYSGGSEVVLEVGKDKYVRFGHVVPSKNLKAGEEIKKGQVIGRFGHSKDDVYSKRMEKIGIKPHLHLQLTYFDPDENSFDPLLLWGHEIPQISEADNTRIGGARLTVSEDVKTRLNQEKVKIDADAQIFIDKNKTANGASQIAAKMQAGHVVGDELDYALERANGVSFVQSRLKNDFIATLLKSDEGFLSVLLGLQDTYVFSRQLSKEELDNVVLTLNTLNYSEGTGLEIFMSEDGRSLQIINRPNTLIRAPNLVNVDLSAADLVQPRRELARLLWDKNQQVSRQGEPLTSVNEGATYLAIPTHNAPNLLNQTVKDYIDNLILFGHRNIQIVVFDDTQDPGLIEKYKAYIRELDAYARQKGLTKGVKYIGLTEKKDFKDKITDKILENRPETDREAVKSFVEGAFKPSAGGNRNFIMAYLAGNKIVLADHDSKPTALVDKKSLLNRGRIYDDQNIIFGSTELRKDIPAEMAQVAEIPTDFIAGINRLLGKQANTLGDYGVRSRSHHPLNYSVEGPITADRSRDRGKVRIVKPVASGDFDLANLVNVRSGGTGTIVQLFQNDGALVKSLSPQALDETLRGQLTQWSVMTGPIQQAVIADEGRSEATTQLGMDLSEVTPGMPTSLRLDDYTLAIFGSLADPDAKLAISSVASSHQRSRAGIARGSVVELALGDTRAATLYYPLVDHEPGEIFESVLAMRQRAASLSESTQESMNAIMEELGRQYLKNGHPIQLALGDAIKYMEALVPSLLTAKYLAEQWRKSTALGVLTRNKEQAALRKKAALLNRFIEDARQNFGVVTPQDGFQDEAQYREFVRTSAEKFLESTNKIIDAEIKTLGNTLANWGPILDAAKSVQKTGARLATSSPVARPKRAPLPASRPSLRVFKQEIHNWSDVLGELRKILTDEKEATKYSRIETAFLFNGKPEPLASFNLLKQFYPDLVFRAIFESPITPAEKLKKSIENNSDLAWELQLDEKGGVIRIIGTKPGTSGTRLATVGDIVKLNSANDNKVGMILERKGDNLSLMEAQPYQGSWASGVQRHFAAKIQDIERNLSEDPELDQVDSVGSFRLSIGQKVEVFDNTSWHAATYAGKTEDGRLFLSHDKINQSGFYGGLGYVVQGYLFPQYVRIPDAGARLAAAVDETIEPFSATYRVAPKQEVLREGDIVSLNNSDSVFLAARAFAANPRGFSLPIPLEFKDKVAAVTVNQAEDNPIEAVIDFFVFNEEGSRLSIGKIRLSKDILDQAKKANEGARQAITGQTLKTEVSPAAATTAVILRDFRLGIREVHAISGQRDVAKRITLSQTRIIRKTFTTKAEYEALSEGDKMLMKIAERQVKSQVGEGQVLYQYGFIDTNNEFTVDPNFSDQLPPQILSVAKVVFQGSLPDTFLKHLGSLNETQSEALKFGVVLTESRVVDGNKGNIFPDIAADLVSVMVGSPDFANPELVLSYIQRYTNKATQAVTMTEALNAMNAVPLNATQSYYRDRGLVFQPIAALLWQQILQTARMVTQAIGAAA